MAKRFFELPSEETKSIISEYYSEQNVDVLFPSNIFDYLSCLLKSKNDRIIVVSDKWLNRVANKLKIRSILLSKVEMHAVQSMALGESLKNLSMKGIPCYMFNRVGQVELSHYSRSAFERIQNKSSFPKMIEDRVKYDEDLKEILEELYSDKYLDGLVNIPQVIKRGTAYGHKDFQSDLINVVGGKRIVSNQIKDSKCTIHIYGRCGAFGYAVEDKDTLPSKLQKKMIERGYTDISVMNHGLWGGEDKFIDHNIINDSQYMKPGDIVLIYMKHYSAVDLKKYINHGLNYYDITEEFHMNDESKWCFYDKPGHVNHKGYDIIANIILDKLIKSEFKGKDKILNTNIKSKNNYIQKYFSRISNDEFLDSLDAYVNEIKSKYPIREHEVKIGSIIMNCNPFTLGHRYLIDYASQKVDRLYIFIVEEDKSFFKFKDRFELVKKGTSDLENVIVVPSREFMISAYTFPEYFMKDYMQNVDIDMTKDLQIFSEQIAPKLNITVRFVGEEPIDIVTRTYNESMRSILPKHGIEFVEIPRKEVTNEGVISASKVRKMLENGNYKDMKNYLPITTYEYLMENYAEKTK